MCYAHSSKKTRRGGTNYARRQYRKKRESIGVTQIEEKLGLGCY